ncbi:MAG TPA: ATPase, partial [Methanothermobacter thermautotrophicus]|nr:ATPase [Methanothermobacter thermautotrophicus]
LGMDPESYMEKELLYVIDAISSISGPAADEGSTYFSSSVHNPTDIMVKLGVAIRNITNRYTMFRSVLDSLTTLMAFNDEMLIVRVLTAYIMRIKEAGGTAVVTYTEGSADPKVETMLKAVVDNIIHLDGSELTVEAMVGTGRVSAPYTIDDSGIKVVHEG